MAIHIDHIRDVSFKNYFLDVDHNAPKNGQIEVNKNTFEVSFASPESDDTHHDMLSSGFVHV